MKKFLFLSASFLLVATSAMAQVSNRGFYRGGLSSGFVLFFVHGNGALSVYTSEQGLMSSGGGDISSTGFFSFSTTTSSNATGGTVNGNVSGDSVSGQFTPTGLPQESFTATRVPIFGPTADIAGRYFGIAFQQPNGPYRPFTVIVDSQGRVVVNGLGTDSISNSFKQPYSPLPESFGVHLAPEFSEQIGYYEVHGPNTNVSVAHGVMEGTFTAGGVTYQFRASKESPSNHLANIATRGNVTTGQYGQLIGGLIITGGPKLVLLRAIGPSLKFFFPPPGFPGDHYLGNPMLQLFVQNGQAPIGVNDDWQTNANAADINATGIAPSDPKEAALLVRLEPGSYTAVVSSGDGGDGISLVEVYEIDRD
jgi:hypothetical protein